MMVHTLKFEPILKETIWGGDEICRFKGLHARRSGIGESWELSHVKNNASVVVNGELKGKSLDELVKIYGEKLLGRKVIKRFGAIFPLLIKFIDARDALSIQVHPGDRLAKKRHDSFGKTEMWYVVRAAKDAYLYAGFAKPITPDGYLRSLADDTFVDYLQKHEVKQGDVFFLPAGRVHAIGAGCFIAEIQQTSDVTYRIYDYNRKDASGKMRELHTGLATDAIDYTVYPNYKLDYHTGQQPVQPLVTCPYFTTNLIEGTTGDAIQRSYHGSFSVLICLEGTMNLSDENGYIVDIKQGETVLIPAENHQTAIRFIEAGKLLETYI